MNLTPTDQLQKIVDHVNPEPAKNHQRSHRELHQGRLPGKTVFERTQPRIAETGHGMEQRIPERLRPAVFFQKPRQHQHHADRFTDQRIGNNGPGQPLRSTQGEVVA